MVSRVRIVVFSLDELRIGLELARVERVIAAVAVTPLPGAPEIVLGAFNLHGEIVPVLDVRRRFSRPTRPVRPEDHFVLVRAGERDVALVADAVEGVREIADEVVVPSAAVLPELRYVRGVVRTPDGLVLVHDLATFLSLDEAAALAAALSQPEPSLS